MEARITRRDAEQAILEGVETARLRRVIAEKDKEIEELSMRLTKAEARLYMDKSIFHQRNRELVRKWKHAKEERAYVQREARNNMIDTIILGAFLGVVFLGALILLILR